MTYPRTEFPVFNKEIKNYVNPLLDEFMEYGEAPIQPDFPYTLDMYYEKYQEKDDITYVFFTSFYLGGAHPNNTIKTITYNKKEDKIITIDTLIEEYPNLLEILSEESRNILKKYPNFKNLNQSMNEMLLEGTKTDRNNFRNFAFSKDGLIIFFEQYQIAPYSEGSFRITVPYQKFQ